MGNHLNLSCFMLFLFFDLRLLWFFNLLHFSHFRFLDAKVWMQHATGRLQRYTLPFQHGQYSISSTILFGKELCWKFLEDSQNRTTEGCFGNVLKTVLLYLRQLAAGSGPLGCWAAGHFVSKTAPQLTRCINVTDAVVSEMLSSPSLSLFSFDSLLLCSVSDRVEWLNLDNTSPKYSTCELMARYCVFFETYDGPNRFQTHWKLEANGKRDFSYTQVWRL